MQPTLVHCRACERAWHSATIADGLRELGSCPRCGGELVWAEGPPPESRVDRATVDPDIAPHLVLGVPRR